MHSWEAIVIAKNWDKKMTVRIYKMLKKTI